MLLNFKDAYLGYNQIPMFKLDEEHASFITDHQLQCFKSMSFNLKNARATYQRLVNTMFKDLSDKTVEVYVSDMLVKLNVVGDHMTHLGEMFSMLRRYRMKLNLLSSVYLEYCYEIVRDCALNKLYHCILDCC